MNKFFLPCILLLVSTTYGQEIKELAELSDPLQEKAPHPLHAPEKKLLAQPTRATKAPTTTTNSIVHANATIVSPKPASSSKKIQIIQSPIPKQNISANTDLNDTEKKSLAQPAAATEKTSTIITPVVHANATIIAPKPIASEAKATPTATQLPSEQLTLATNSPITKSESKNIPHYLLVNTIDKDMITYKRHWSGPHAPTDFHVKINGTKLPNALIENSTKNLECPTTEVIISEQDLEVELYYKFTVMGVTHHEDTKRYHCKVPPSTQKLAIKFSWDADSRILIDAIEGQTRSELTIVEIL